MNEAKKNVLIIVRGVPGSGKSTLAKCILRGQLDYRHLEADMYFLDEKTGEYRFNKEEIGVAHAWCQAHADKFLSEGLNVIVSNTFTRAWEIAPYVQIARRYGATIQIITMQGQFGNMHGVPEEAVQAMLDRFEWFIDLEKL